MEILDLFREFAKKIQKDELITSYKDAEKNMNADTELQKSIEEFNSKKADLNFELTQKERDEEKIKQINAEVRESYESIMNNENMKDFNHEKEKLDKLVKDINFILVEAINGADPMTVDPDAYAGCAGDCGGCAGCH